MVVVEKKIEEKFFNGGLLTMPMNEQPPFQPLAHLLDPRKRRAMGYKTQVQPLEGVFSKR